ncbi:MAG TPA: major facilitator superfamily domain-containing protein 6 [Anaerolineales bacterium]|nr:major facilitator superfamily domain-containing protein 6 [Anaerolineales bacterium]
MFPLSNGTNFGRLTLFYQSQGFSGTQIGLLSGITPLVTMLFAPFWTGLADATGRHRLILSLTLLGAAAAISIFASFTSFTAILLLAVLYAAFTAPANAFADSATMLMLKDKKEKYGQVRVGGTLGFGISALLAGVLVESFGLKLAFWGCAILLLSSLAVSQKLVHNPHRASQQAGADFRLLLRNPRWLLFLAMAFAGGIAIAGNNTYFFPYLKELGAPESLMGLALTIGTLTEIPVLFFGHHLLRRFKPYGLLILAMVVTGARLLLFAAANTPEQLLVVQLLNGLTFPAMWVAGVAYVDEIAPPELSATAQGMFGAMVFGFGAAVGGFIGGPLLETSGGRGIYLTFGIIVVVVVALAALGMRLLPKKAHFVPASMDSE